MAKGPQQYQDNKRQSIGSQIERFASAFLVAGAQAVIGTTKRVTDLGARLFAESFYTFLLEGESLGEALRKTKCNLYSQKETSASWASFVMYGRPTMQLIKRKSISWKLPSWLDEEKFDNGAWGIVTTAINLAKASNSSVSTLHLFLSMFRKQGSLIRELIRLQEIDLERVDRTFKQIIFPFHQKTCKQNGEWKVNFSPNAQHLLKIAEEIATFTGSTIVEEFHLVRAFIKLRKSEAHKILHQLGVNMERAVGAQTIKTKQAASVISSDMKGLFLKRGLLNESRFTLQSRLAFYAASGFAANWGSALMGTPHLFAGLCSLANGRTRQFLYEQNIDPEKLIEEIRNVLSAKEVDKTGENYLKINNLSGNLQAVLKLSQEISLSEGSAYIDERHLLLAIFENSKYSTCKIIEGFGIDVELLKKAVKK